MDLFKQDLIRLGTTNPELRPHIREILAGCEKKKEARSKSAAFVNRLPAQYRPLADRAMSSLSPGSAGDQEKVRILAFGFVVYLLSLVAPEQAILVDRLLAKSRRAPAVPVRKSPSQHFDYDDPQDFQEDSPDIRDTAPMEYYTERGL